MVKLLKILRAIDGVNLTTYEIFQIIFQPDYNKDEVSHSIEKIKNAIESSTVPEEDDIKFLHHPGRIHYFYRKQVNYDVKFFLCEQESSIFTQDIFLLDRMVFDHTQPYYEEAFEKCTIADA